MGQRSFARMLGGRWAQTLLSRLERGATQFLRPDEVPRFATLCRVDPNRLRRLVPPRPLLPPETPLAKLIRSRREALGLTRVELARRAGSHWKHIGLVEHTGRGLRYEFMLRLAKALQLDPAVLAPFTARHKSPAGSRLGRLIRERRKRLGLSAAALGRLVGVHKASVLAVERGEVGLTRNDGSVERYARALGLKLAAIESVRPLPSIRQRTPDTRTLGGYLTRRRLELRWSQRELARRTALAEGTICYLEENRTRPHLRSLRTLARVLDLDLDVLLALRPGRRRKKPPRPIRSRRTRTTT